jgi:hypothetical protein
LEAGDIARVWSPDLPEHEIVPSFLRQVWKLIGKMSTSRVRPGHPKTDQMFGEAGGGTSQAPAFKSLTWCGHHALEWCKAGGARRMLDGWYRPCDDWEVPKNAWYQRLKAMVEERYGRDFGNPPEAPE